MKISVVGAGVMGSNHARVIAESTDSSLVGVVDVDQERASRLAEAYGARSISLDEALEQSDAVVVAAATSHHMEPALAVIGAGLPLLLEKPLADNVADVDAIIAASKAASVPLACGFVERFNPAVMTAMSLLDDVPVHVTSTRHSPHDPRVQSSVVHDLLIHDIDLVCRLMDGEEIRRVSGVSWASPNGVVDVADCSMTFVGGTCASLSASRVSHRKVRELRISSPSQLIEVDLLRQDVTVYRHVRQEISGGTYRSQTIVDIPFVRHRGEPLAVQLQHFIELARGERDAEIERSTLRAPHVFADQIAIDSK